jgi:hypothetical protein
VIPTTASPPVIIEIVVEMIPDAVVYLNRPVVTKIVYVVFVVVPLRVVKAAG